MPEIRPLTREETQEVLSLLGDAATLVGNNVVHVKALTILSKLRDVESTVLSTLPGGECLDKCEACGVPIGTGDQFSSYQDGVRVCSECEPVNSQAQ